MPPAARSSKRPAAAAAAPAREKRQRASRSSVAPPVNASIRGWLGQREEAIERPLAPLLYQRGSRAAAAPPAAATQTGERRRARRMVEAGKGSANIREMFRPTGVPVRGAIQVYEYFRDNLADFAGKKVQVTFSAPGAQGGSRVEEFVIPQTRQLLTRSFWKHSRNIDGTGAGLPFFGLAMESNGALVYGYGGDDTEMTVVAADGVDGLLPFGFAQQAFLDSQELPHCFLSPIHSHFLRKAEAAMANPKAAKKTVQNHQALVRAVERFLQQYEGRGVPAAEVSQICEALKITCSIEVPFAQRRSLVYHEDRKSLRGTFRFINTRSDHVDLSQGSSGLVLGSAFDRASAVEASAEELADMLAQLREDDVPHAWRSGGGGSVSTIFTLDAVYQRPPTAYQRQVRILEKANPWLRYSRVDAAADPDLFAFLKHSINWNCSPVPITRGLPVDQLQILDLRASYATFADCEHFRGFPSKITDFRECDRVLGEGAYYISAIDLSAASDKVRQLNGLLGDPFRANQIYTSLDLRFMTSLGISYTVTRGAFSRSEKPTFTFEFHGDIDQKTGMFDRGDGGGEDEDGAWEPGEGPAFYAIYVGATSNPKDFYSSINVHADEKYAAVLASTYKSKSDQDAGKMETRIDYFRDSKSLSITWPVSGKRLANPLLAAFVNASEFARVFAQLLDMRLELVAYEEKDGIAVIPHDFPVHKGFRWKGQAREVEYYGENARLMVSCEESDAENGFEQDLDFSRLGPRSESADVCAPREIHRGAGGCGKTHSILRTDSGYRSVLFCAPSHLLCAAKREEYPGCVAMPHAALFNCNPIDIMQYSVIVVDECSMLTDATKHSLTERYPQLLLIFVGDVRSGFPFQLPQPGAATCLTEEGCAVVDHVVNRRLVAGDPLCLLARSVRAMMDPSTYVAKLPSEADRARFVLAHIMRFMRQRRRVVTVSEMIKLHETSDVLLCPTHLAGYRLSEPLNQKHAPLKRWRSEDTRMCTIDGVRKRCYNGSAFVAEERPHPACVDTWASTVHASQGVTVESRRIFIDSSSMAWALQLAYTAISRARSLEQIYWVVPDERDDDETSQEFTVSEDGQLIRARSSYDLYILRSKLIPQVYVGRTKLDLAKRREQHLADWRLVRACKRRQAHVCRSAALVQMVIDAGGTEADVEIVLHPTTNTFNMSWAELLCAEAHAISEFGDLAVNRVKNAQRAERTVREEVAAAWKAACEKDAARPKAAAAESWDEEDLPDLDEVVLDDEDNAPSEYAEEGDADTVVELSAAGEADYLEYLLMWYNDARAGVSFPLRGAPTSAEQATKALDALLKDTFEGVDVLDFYYDHRVDYWSQTEVVLELLRGGDVALHRLPRYTATIAVLDLLRMCNDECSSETSEYDSVWHRVAGEKREGVIPSGVEEVVVDDKDAAPSEETDTGGVEDNVPSFANEAAYIDMLRWYNDTRDSVPSLPLWGAPHNEAEATKALDTLLRDTCGDNYLNFYRDYNVNQADLVLRLLRGVKVDLCRLPDYTALSAIIDLLRKCNEPCGKTAEYTSVWHRVAREKREGGYVELYAQLKRVPI